MKLDPVNPQDYTDFVAYSERKRTRWERFLDKIKPRSAAMRTAVLVVFVVIFSLVMSLWFFWRTLYLPEIQQHARYLAVELELVNNPDIRIFHRNNEACAPRRPPGLPAVLRCIPWPAAPFPK